MRKFIYILPLLSLLFARCNEENKEKLYNCLTDLELSQILFTATTENRTIVVPDCKEPVTAISDSPWCTATVSGRSVTVSVTDNEKYSSRTALLILSCGSKIAELAVIQYGYRFSLSETDFDIDLMPATLKVAVQSRLPYTVSMPTAIPWMTISAVQDTIFIEVLDNQDIISRSGLIEVNSGEITQNVTVTQKGNYLNLSDTEFEMDYMSATHKVVVHSGLSYTVNTLIPVPWINVSTDQDTIFLEVLENQTTLPRLGVIEVSSGLITKNIIITQSRSPILYEEFIGTYTMEYAIVNTSPPNRNRSLTVTIEEKVPGVSYHLKGILRAAEDAIGPIEMKYTGGEIELLGQIVSASATQDRWWLPMSTTVVGISTVIGMVGELTVENNNLTGFTMVDNGVWTTITAGLRCVGFIRRNYDIGATTGAQNIPTIDGQSFIYYPKFIKR